MVDEWNTTLQVTRQLAKTKRIKSRWPLSRIPRVHASEGESPQQARWLRPQYERQSNPELLRNFPKQHDKFFFDNADVALASFNSEFLKNLMRIEVTLDELCATCWVLAPNQKFDMDFEMLNSFSRIFDAGLSSDESCQALMLFLFTQLIFTTEEFFSPTESWSWFEESIVYLCTI